MLATRLATSTLVLVAAIILNGSVGIAHVAASSNSDNALGDLYTNMLQREYTGPISFPDHQVERKAQRSPSLRLRFGRRSDGTFPLFGNRFSKYIEEINKKPIRSPSLRLRFGKRGPVYNDEYEMNDWNRDATNERWQNDNRNALNAQQFGPQNADFDSIDSMPEKRKPVHLRFGRSYDVHGDIPIPDRPEVLSEDVGAQSPKAGDLVSVTDF